MMNLQEPEEFREVFEDAGRIDSIINDEPEGPETIFDWGDAVFDLDELEKARHTDTRRQEITIPEDVIAAWTEFVEHKTGRAIRPGRASLSSHLIVDAMKMYMAVVSGYQWEDVAVDWQNAFDDDKIEDVAKNLRMISFRMTQGEIGLKVKNVRVKSGKKNNDK